MKKILSLIITVCFLALTFSTTVFAYSEKPVEVGPNPGKKLSSSINIDGLSYSEILDKIEEHHKKTFVPTAEDYAKVERILNIYNEQIATHSTSAKSDYDEDKAKLRTGNLIELTLDLEEGVSNSNAVSAIALATVAKSTANSNFPNTWDSAQHFIWNYNMTKNFSKTIARTVGINHEWGMVMINPMIRHFDSEYADRIAAGESESDASAGALAATILYIPEFKDISTTLLPQSYDFFCSFFDADNIMDFWNNCYGRAYAEQNYSSAVNAYTAAKNAGDLIIDGATVIPSNVTSDHYYSVWAWDWYSY